MYKIDHALLPPWLMLELSLHPSLKVPALNRFQRSRLCLQSDHVFNQKDVSISQGLKAAIEDNLSWFVQQCEYARAKFGVPRHAFLTLMA